MSIEACNSWQSRDPLGEKKEDYIENITWLVIVCLANVSNLHDGNELLDVNNKKQKQQFSIKPCVFICNVHELIQK